MKFIDACLHWDPELRLTPEEGLNHPWITNPLNFEAEIEKRKMKELRQKANVDATIEEKVKKMFEEKKQWSSSPASVN